MGDIGELWVLEYCPRHNIYHIELAVDMFKENEKQYREKKIEAVWIPLLYDIDYKRLERRSEELRKSVK